MNCMPLHLSFVLAQLLATRAREAPARAARLPLCLLWTDGVISVWLIRFSLPCQYCFSLHVISGPVWCAHGEYDERHSVDLLVHIWFEILLRANRSNLWNWLYKVNNAGGALSLALESGMFWSLNKQVFWKKPDHTKCNLFLDLDKYNLSLTLNFPLCTQAYPQRRRCKFGRNFHKFACLKN